MPGSGEPGPGCPPPTPPMSRRSALPAPSRPASARRASDAAPSACAACAAQQPHAGETTGAHPRVQRREPLPQRPPRPRDRRARGRQPRRPQRAPPHRACTVDGRRTPAGRFPRRHSRRRGVLRRRAGRAHRGGRRRRPGGLERRHPDRRGAGGVDGRGARDVRRDRAKTSAHLGIEVRDADHSVEQVACGRLGRASSTWNRRISDGPKLEPPGTVRSSMKSRKMSRGIEDARVVGEQANSPHQEQLQVATVVAGRLHRVAQTAIRTPQC